MNRRAFARNIAGAVGAAALLSNAPLSAAADQDASFKLSVMLWTVFRDLPFEERLQKVSDAGYKNVELVGEYEKWSDSDFDRANAKRKSLGISFDTTAGMKHGVGNPKERDAVLADIKAALPDHGENRMSFDDRDVGECGSRNAAGRAASELY